MAKERRGLQAKCVASIGLFSSEARTVLSQDQGMRYNATPPHSATIHLANNPPDSGSKHCITDYHHYTGRYKL